MAVIFYFFFRASVQLTGQSIPGLIWI